MGEGLAKGIKQHTTSRSAVKATALTVISLGVMIGVAPGAAASVDGSALTFGAATIDETGHSTVVFANKLSPGPKEGVMVLPSSDGSTAQRMAVIVGPKRRPKSGEFLPQILTDSPQAPSLHAVILPPHGEFTPQASTDHGGEAVGVVVVRSGPPLGVGEDHMSYDLCQGHQGPVAQVRNPATGAVLWSAEFAPFIGKTAALLPCQDDATGRVLNLSHPKAQSRP